MTPSPLALYEARVTVAKDGRATRVETMDGKEYAVSAYCNALPSLYEGHRVEIIISGDSVRIFGAEANDGTFLLPVSYNDGDASVIIPDQVKPLKMGFPRGRIELHEHAVVIQGGTISNN